MRNSVPLHNISEIRNHFDANERPIFFIGSSNFNLLGIDEWCRNFRYISYIDCYDGRHPNVFVPRREPHPPFLSMEGLNNYLLGLKEVAEYVHSFGSNPAAVFLMSDRETERLARQIGLDIWLPAAEMRESLDNKVNTVRLGDQANVPSVPNVLASVTSYPQLRSLSQELGPDLVIQTPFGDSGHTTFFISSEADFDRYRTAIASAGEVKIMKRIRSLSTAIEACVTRCGTLVSPLMTELVGFPELTPYRGGWCGNEVFPHAFSEETRLRAQRLTYSFGERLRREGYRGYYELDFLIDQDTGELYLGELNPRITGASPITNHCALAHTDAPLFLFHMLEFEGAEFDIDVDEFNSRWANENYVDTMSQLVIKQTGRDLDWLLGAPQTGVWRLQEDGTVLYSRFDHYRRAVANDQEAFFLRISGPGDPLYEAADLGILISRGRLMTDDFSLNDRARRWIAGFRRTFTTASGAAIPGTGAGSEKIL